MKNQSLLVGIPRKEELSPAIVDSKGQIVTLSRFALISQASRKNKCVVG